MVSGLQSLLNKFNGYKIFIDHISHLLAIKKSSKKSLNCGVMGEITPKEEKQCFHLLEVSKRYSNQG